MGQEAGSSDCVVVQRDGLAQLSKCSGLQGLELLHSVVRGTPQLGRTLAVEDRRQSQGLVAGLVCTALVHTCLCQAADTAAGGQVELLEPAH